MNRRSLILRLTCMAALAGAAAGSMFPLGGEATGLASPGQAGRVEISGNFANSKIVIATSQRYAGAIESLTWNGREFINSYDHGRGLQSAAGFGWGECFNPTEAGSRDDGTGATSTSELVSLKTTDHQLITRTRIAFWLAPGETERSCRGLTALNDKRLSDHELLKTVTVGARGLRNVIEHDVTFRVPAKFDMATFEALTAYLPPSFSEFWTYDPERDRLLALSDGPGLQPLPIIMATPGGAYALGVFSPDLRKANLRRGGYGRWRFSIFTGGDPTVKWSCIFRARPVPAGDYRYTCYSIVGTLADVKNAMAALARQQ